MSRKPQETAIPDHSVEIPNLPELVRQANEQHSSQLAVLERYGDGQPYDRARYIGKCRYHMQRSAEEALESGRALLVMKAHELHGDFLSCLENIGLEARLAQRMMQAAVKLGNAATSPHLVAAAGNKSKILELLVLDDEEIAELEAGGFARNLNLDEISRMSTRELREALRKRDAAIADLKEDMKAQGRFLADKDSKINELALKLSKRQESPPESDEPRPELAGEALLEALRDEAGDVVSMVAASLRSRVVQLFNHYGDGPVPDLARVAAAQAFGLVIVAARTACDELGLTPAETVHQSIDDPEKAIWDVINAQDEAVNGTEIEA
ncbi:MULTISPECIES: hypothetical protein [Methylococcus]|uniref:DUF3102 domain-containing protein n=1 Tax=Methylococcus capsulatus TaxID=414 RepID=A0ABZ2F2H9_METCP|nr:hypothetical protein [Methylococcus sp. BF19-07]